MSWVNKIIKNKEMRHKILEKLSFVPDGIMVRLQYKILTRRSLNLSNPKRFTEKLQWYKLYYRDMLMADCVDKYEVRNYVENCGAGKYLNEIYGVFNDVNKIDFSILPDKFVIKDTLGGGGNSVIVCTDKTTLNLSDIKNKMQSWLDIDWKNAENGREWVYNQRPHRILIEKYIESTNPSGLTDYKFFCFNGKVNYVYGIDNRNLGSSAQVGIYDRDFNLLHVQRADEQPLDHIIKKPDNYDEMITLAERLSMEFPQVRIDLFNENGKIIFGEMTFFDGSGYFSFSPDSFDFEMGNRWVLPSKKKMQVR